MTDLLEIRASVTARPLVILPKNSDKYKRKICIQYKIGE